MICGAEKQCAFEFDQNDAATMFAQIGGLVGATQFERMARVAAMHRVDYTAQTHFRG